MPFVIRSGLVESEIQNNPFRKKGVPASKIAPALIEPAVDFILAEPTEKLFVVGPVQEVTV